MVSKVSLTKLVAFIGKFGVLPNLLFSIFNQVGLSLLGVICVLTSLYDFFISRTENFLACFSFYTTGHNFYV